MVFEVLNKIKDLITENHFDVIKSDEKILLAKHRTLPLTLEVKGLEGECEILLRSEGDVLRFVEDFTTENSIDDLEDIIDEVEALMDRISGILMKVCKVKRDLKGILDLRESIEYYLDEVLE